MWNIPGVRSAEVDDFNAYGSCRIFVNLRAVKAAFPGRYWFTYARNGQKDPCFLRRVSYAIRKEIREAKRAGYVLELELFNVPKLTRSVCNGIRYSDGYDGADIYFDIRVPVGED